MECEGGSAPREARDKRNLVVYNDLYSVQNLGSTGSQGFQETEYRDMRLQYYAVSSAALFVLTSARGSTEFRVNQPVRLAASERASPVLVTDNTVRLERADSNSVSAGYLDAVRSGNHVEGVYSRLQVWRLYQDALTYKLIRLEWLYSHHVCESWKRLPRSAVRR